MTDITNVAIAGLGAIGARVFSELVQGKVPNKRLAAVLARDTKKAGKTCSLAGIDVQIVALGEINIGHHHAVVIVSIFLFFRLANLVAPRGRN